VSSILSKSGFHPTVRSGIMSSAFLHVIFAGLKLLGVKLSRISGAPRKCSVFLNARRSG
jgi:hypothetical protein